MANSGDPTLKILSISRLIRSVDRLGDNSQVMERQIENMQARLHSGIDLGGSPFAPYKTKRPDNQTHPLAQAYKLFDRARYDVSQSHNGFDFTATITGRAATIAFYQNFKRRFVGFSEDDQVAARQGIVATLKEAMGKWR